MGSFVFQLERVLSWRRTVLAREEARLELLKAGLRALEERDSDLRSTRIDSRDAIRQRNFIEGRELAALETFGRRLDREERENREEILQAGRAIVAHESVLVDARRNARLVEKLKERRYEEWRLETDREIEVDAGEFAVQQWRRENGLVKKGRVRACCQRLCRDQRHSFSPPKLA
jgi:hypothetical protein